ncbi:MAG: polyphosphate:AMP phosphotransferase [Gammaproteobacteria bacterium]
MIDFTNLPTPKNLVGDDQAESRLRVSLLECQQTLRGSRHAALIIVAGVNGSGTGQIIRSLGEWFDPRDMRSYAFSKRSDEERERPLFWRYWMSLPPRGNIATYSGAWYAEAIIKRAKNKITKRAFQRTIKHIQQFEADLANDGTLVLKYWLHLSKSDQAARFAALKADKETAWRVSKDDEKSTKHYDDYVACAGEVIDETNRDYAPWALVNSKDPSSCAWYIARDVALRLGSVQNTPTEKASGTSDNEVYRARNILSGIDLTQKLSKTQYQRRLRRYQARLAKLHRRAIGKGISCVIVLEGWDAAGKGGTIRRITYALDPRQYQVIRIGAPSDEELAHHYLWRFWRHIPRAGNTTIYDRSWYGRVLVERVEGLVTASRWRQAYDEINDFEQALVEHGTVMSKFWLHLSPGEQLRRFKHREEVPHKRYKITAEDYRNREKWAQYELAVNDMIARTDTSWAPWRVVSSEDKRYARVQVLEHLCDAFEQQT